MKRNNIYALIVAIAVFMLALTCIIILPSLDKHNHSPSDSTQNAEGDIEDDKQGKTYDTIIYDDIIGAPITDNMPDGVHYKSITQSTVIDTESGSRITIEYPSFSGYVGINTDEEINNLVSLYNSDMQRIYAQGMYKLLDSGAKVVYEVSDFEVTYADNLFISIVYRGFYGIYGGTSPIDTGTKHFVSSLNIDIRKMQIITSDMLIADFANLKSVFCEGRMELVSENADLLDNAGYTDIFSQYNSQYRVYPMFFFTEDKIMTVISLTSDLGGYAVFSYSKNEAKDFLNEYQEFFVEYYS